MMQKKVLIVGVGSIGRRHIRNLQSLGYRDIYCLRRKVEPGFDEKNGTKTITKWADAFEIDFFAVFVCTPSSKHFEALQYAGKLNCAFMVEKPLVTNEDMLKIIEKKGLKNNIFLIGFMLRFHPHVKLIKGLIQSNEIGQIFSARLEFGSYLPYWHPYEDYHDSYASQVELGGGVINTITHELDMMLFLFGNPEKVIAAKRNLGILDINSEELCEAIFYYNWGLATIHLDYLQKDYERKVILYGTEGKITWIWRKNEVLIEKHNSEPDLRTLNDFDVNQLYIDEIKYFFSLIENEIYKHDLDFDYAIENTKWMLKIHESSKNEEGWVK